MKRSRTRQLLLATALIGTLVAVWLAPDEAPADTSEARVTGGERAGPRPSLRSPVATAKNLPDSSRQRPSVPEERTRAYRAAFARLTDASTSLFAQRQWYVPPPPPPLPPVAPSKPSAPPLPIKWLGRLADADDNKTFLNWNGRVYIAKVGDVLQQTYRLDEVDNTRLVFTYLPLSEQQTLYTGK